MDVLQPADLSIEKIAYSAFYMTRPRMGPAQVRHRATARLRIVTNGGVASTVRDAHVRDFDTTVIEDGCAAFSPAVHATAIDALRPVCRVATISDIMNEIEAA